MNNYSIRLGITYYNNGFFNVGKTASNNLGEHEEDLKLILQDKNEILVKINKTANRNGSVRIYGGSTLRSFIQQNFHLYDIMEFQIQGLNVIKIL
jgi:hypothetical protein